MILDVEAKTVEVVECKHDDAEHEIPRKQRTLVCSFMHDMLAGNVFKGTLERIFVNTLVFAIMKL